MDKPRRSSRKRLIVLLGIALVGYEYVLYRHWVMSVPLVPTTTLELPPDRVPVGFTRTGEFILVRRFSQPIGNNAVVASGLLQFRTFPAGHLVGERLAHGDRIATALPMSSGVVDEQQVTPYFHFHAIGGAGDLMSRGVVLPHQTPTFASFRTSQSASKGASHDTLDSPWRTPTFYCLDRDQFLCLADGALQSYDPNTDCVSWTLSRVHSVAAVKGQYAFVIKFRDETPLGKRQVYPVLLSLKDGRCNERVFPDGNAWELLDISPDGRLIAYRVNSGFEVWSIEQRSKVWTKTIAELGTRRLIFSDNSQTLVNCTLDVDGRLQRSAFRSSDGMRLTTGDEPADPDGSIIPPMETSGSRYAFFHAFSSGHHDSELALRLYRLAAQARLFVRSPDNSRKAALFDVERGKPLGIIDTTSGHSLMTAPDGSGFALHRYGSPIAPPTLEFYTLPPRNNWLWWSIRAIGLPLAIAALAIGTSLYRRRQRFHELEGSRVEGLEKSGSFTMG